jgi:predicted esterase
MRVFSLGISILLLLLFVIPSQSQSLDLRTSYQKGMDSKNAGEYNKAIEYFSLWTEANPRDAIALVQLATCQARINKDTAVILSLEKALKAGLQEVYMLDQDSILKRLIQSKSELAISLSSAFWGENDPWNALLRNAHEQANAKRFPIAFAEQKRLARYRILYPKEYDSTKRYRAVLLLHGNGLEPIFMLKWAEQLGLNDHFIIAPEAPYVKFKETMQSGAMKLSGRGEDQKFPDSLNDDVIMHTAEWYLSSLRHAQQTLPIFDGPHIVMGFSQGGFFASVLLSRFPAAFSGAITLCGSMFPEGKVKENLSNVQTLQREILIIHGRQDQIVPFSVAEEYAKTLSQANIQHQFISFDGGHWPADELNDEIKEWIESH